MSHQSRPLKTHFLARKPAFQPEEDVLSTESCHTSESPVSGAPRLFPISLKRQISFPAPNPGPLRCFPAGFWGSIYSP